MAIDAGTYYAAWSIMVLQARYLCNTKETVCMIFKPKYKEKYVTDKFPNFVINGCLLNFVS